MHGEHRDDMSQDLWAKSPNLNQAYLLWGQLNLSYTNKTKLSHSDIMIANPNVDLYTKKPC